MNKYFNTLTNARGDSLPNYRVQVVTSAGVSVTIYSDSSGTRFTDSAGNVVNYATASSSGKVQFYWTAASGQVLQVLDTSGQLVDATADFADNFVLSNLPGNIAQSAVTNLTTDLAAKAASADLASTASDKGAALVGTTGGSTLQAMLNGFCLPDTFGVVDDANYLNTTTRIDQAVALQAWLTYAVTNRLTPYCNKPIRAYSSATLTYDPSALTGAQKMPDVRLSNLTVCFGTAVTKGFVFGSITKVIDSSVIELPNVRRAAISWSTLPNAECGAIVMRNFRYCTVTLSDVRGFAAGFQHWSEGFGVTYNTYSGGFMQDCRFGEVICCTGADSYVNENTWTGGSGSYSSSSTGETTALVAGIYFTVGTAGYKGSNNNRWYGRSFEGTSTASHASVTESVPVWYEGCGNNNRVMDCRVEVWRGPVMHVRGDVNSDANALYGINNEFDAQVILDNAGEGRSYVRQVGGAYGNLATYPGHRSAHTWHSGPLREKLFSGGGADAARTVAPFILREGVDATNYRQLSFSGRAQTNIYGQQWNNGGCFIMLDTSRVKDFELSAETLEGFAGRWFLAAYDANLTLLGATSTDSYATERNIKFEGATFTSLYGGGYQTGGDAVKRIRVTVRNEVKFLFVGPCSGTGAVVVNGFAVTGFAPDQTSAGTGSAVGALLYDPLVTNVDGQRTASVNPFTAGTHGFWSQGQIANNTAAASAAASGWVCTAGVALGAAFAISTAYSVPGQVVIANGNAYYVKTAGTTSGAGTGPSGTTAGTDYTDGTVVFRYLGAKAAGTPLANVP